MDTREYYDGWSKPQLQGELVKYKLKFSGNISELVDRLVSYHKGEDIKKFNQRGRPKTPGKEKTEKRTPKTKLTKLPDDLPDDYSEWFKDWLVFKLKEEGLSISGKKQDLIRRLKDYENGKEVKKFGKPGRPKSPSKSVGSSSSSGKSSPGSPRKPLPKESSVSHSSSGKSIPVKLKNVHGNPKTVRSNPGVEQRMTNLVFHGKEDPGKSDDETPSLIWSIIERPKTSTGKINLRLYDPSTDEEPRSLTTKELNTVILTGPITIRGIVFDEDGNYTYYQISSKSKSITLLEFFEKLYEIYMTETQADIPVPIPRTRIYDFGEPVSDDDELVYHGLIESDEADSYSLDLRKD